MRRSVRATTYGHNGGGEGDRGLVGRPSHSKANTKWYINFCTFQQFSLPLFCSAMAEKRGLRYAICPSYANGVLNGVRTHTQPVRTSAMGMQLAHPYVDGLSFRFKRFKFVLFYVGVMCNRVMYA